MKVKKNISAFTVVEVLIGFVVATIMLLALYSSYEVFSKSYISIIDKINVNKALRISMATIVKDIRAAGYVDINSINYGKSFSALSFVNGGASTADKIDIIYENSSGERVIVKYFLLTDSTGTYLGVTRRGCANETCTNFSGTGLFSFENEKLFKNIEDLQFEFYDASGNKLSSPTSGVKYVQITLIYRSENQINKIIQSKTFVSGDRTNLSFNDLYYRDVLTTSIYPRNLIKN
jgi:hypothetical protein